MDHCTGSGSALGASARNQLLIGSDVCPPAKYPCAYGCVSTITWLCIHMQKLILCYGPGHRIWLCHMLRGKIWLCVMGHSSEFGYAPSAIPQNLVKRHRLQRRIIFFSKESYKLHKKAFHFLFRNNEVYNCTCLSAIHKAHTIHA
jgi:hypothetical protein